MADSFITVPPDSTGKSLDTRTAPDGNHREVVVTGSPTTADVAEVDAANGLDVDVTRVQGSVAVTNADLAAIAASASVLDDWDESDRAKVNSIVGQAGVAAGAGAVGATVQRVTLASDDPAVAALQILDNAIAGSEMQVDIVSGAVSISGAVDTELPAAALLADNTANPTVPAVGAFGMVYDGSTWDRAPGTSADGTLVNLGANNDVSLNAGTNNIGDVDVLTVPAPLSTAGGGTEATALRVTLANDSTGVLSVDDNGGSLTVDGSVTANAGTNLNTSALALEAGGNLAAAVTALQIIDNVVSGSEAQVDIVAALPAGTNNIGDVDVLTLPALPAGTNNIGDVDVLSVIPGTAATNLGKAIDSVPGATDTGVTALVVRDDALAALTPIDGDYTTLRVDSTGALWTRSTSAAGGTSATDEDAFTASTSTGTPVMGAFDDVSPDVLAEGTLGITRSTANRALHVNLRDASGNEVSPGAGTQYTEDAAAAANPVGTALNLIRQDALSGLVTTDGDNVAARGTNNGELYVKHVDAIPVTDNGGALTVDGTVAVTGVSTLAEQQTQTTHLATIAGDTTDIEAAVELIDDTVKVLGTDTYTEATTKGLLIGAIRRDADTTLVDTTNEVSPLQVDAAGRLKVEAFSGETLPVSLSGVSTLAEQQTQTTHLATIAGDTTAIETAIQIMDDWDESDRAKVNPIAGQAGVQGASGAVTALTQRVVLATDVGLPAGTSNIGDVDVLTLPALVAGTANIGDVDIASAPTGTSSITVQGTAANAAAAVGNPVYVGGRASTALPTDVGADGDVVASWLNRNGLQIVSMVPGAGLNADPYTLLSVTAQYTTTQTSAVLLAGGASERIIVTSIQIQAGGTTAGTLQVYFGTGAYSRGTNSAIFDGEFAPSATLKPGWSQSPPSGYRSPTLGHDVLVTGSAAINPLTITIWYYLLGV